MMTAHSFLNFIFLVIREKDQVYILSLESVTSILKPINLLKVVYHPVNCLLHHYNEMVVSQILNPVDHNPRRITKADKDFIKKLDFKDIKSPVRLGDTQKNFLKKEFHQLKCFWL